MNSQTKMADTSADNNDTITRFNNTSTLDNGCNLTVERLKDELLGKSLSAASSMADCFTIKDTLMEGDDEVEWKAKAFYKEGRLIFLAEANWQDTKSISRITILNNAIKTSLGVAVGSELSAIKDCISNKIPSMPDGYLSFQDARYSQILYNMDIDKHSELVEGRIDKVDKMPQDIKVSSITVQK